MAGRALLAGYHQTQVLLFVVGFVPWQVHRQWLHHALLQAHAQQEAHPLWPGVNWPRVLQLPRLDQVQWHDNMGRVEQRISHISLLAIQFRADSRLVPSQWETLLQSYAVSHWLGANLESALELHLFSSSPLVYSDWQALKTNSSVSVFMLYFFTADPSVYWSLYN